MDVWLHFWCHVRTLVVECLIESVQVYQLNIFARYKIRLFYVVRMIQPKPFDNKPSHSMCCHLAIGAGTKILPIQ